MRSQCFQSSCHHRLLTSAKHFKLDSHRRNGKNWNLLVKQLKRLFWIGSSACVPTFVQLLHTWLAHRQSRGSEDVIQRNRTSQFWLSDPHRHVLSDLTTRQEGLDLALFCETKMTKSWKLSYWQYWPSFLMTKQVWLPCLWVFSSFDSDLKLPGTYPDDKSPVHQADHPILIALQPVKHCSSVAICSSIRWKDAGYAPMHAWAHKHSERDRKRQRDKPVRKGRMDRWMIS